VKNNTTKEIEKKAEECLNTQGTAQINVNTVSLIAQGANIIEIKTSDYSIPYPLIDFTDPIGYLRHDYYIKRYKMIQPYLYKASNDNNGTEVTILGTMHDLPASSLPKIIHEMLFNEFDILISESFKEEGDNESDIEPYVVQHKNFPDWFSYMSVRVQQDIAAVYLTEYSHKQTLGSIKSSNMISVLMNYSCITYMEGIDQSLADHYKEKEILPLEKDVMYDKQFDNEVNYINLLNQDSAIKFLEQDHYDSYIKNGGCAMSSFKEQIEYLSHNIKFEKKDTVLIQRNKSWTENIVCAAKENIGKRILVAGGVDHIVGTDGVLDMLEKQGFTIQDIKIDLLGQMESPSETWQLHEDFS
jgi:hypothetical protein